MRRVVHRLKLWVSREGTALVHPLPGLWFRDYLLDKSFDRCRNLGRHPILVLLTRRAFPDHCSGVHERHVRHKSGLPQPPSANNVRVWSTSDSHKGGRCRRNKTRRIVPQLLPTNQQSVDVVRLQPTSNISELAFIHLYEVNCMILAHCSSVWSSSPRNLPIFRTEPS